MPRVSSNERNDEIRKSSPPALSPLPGDRCPLTAIRGDSFLRERSDRHFDLNQFDEPRPAGHTDGQKQWRGDGGGNSTNKRGMILGRQRERARARTGVREGLADDLIS